MLAYAGKNYKKTAVKLNREIKAKDNRYISSQITAAEVISPDDDRIKLSETMKKECEGKTIYYNRQHDVVSGEDFKLGISNIKINEKSRYMKMFPEAKNTKGVPCVPDETNVSKVHQLQFHFN